MPRVGAVSIFQPHYDIAKFHPKESLRRQAASPFFELARTFDPAWLYRPVTTVSIRIAELVRNLQAGPLGLYLPHLLLAFVGLLLVAPRLG